MALAEATSAQVSDGGGGGSGDDPVVGGGQAVMASSNRAAGELQCVFADGEDDQDSRMPPQMADISISAARLRGRQDDLAMLHAPHQWAGSSVDPAAEMDGGAEVEARSIGLAGRRRQFLDSIPSQQILMVRILG